MYFWTIVFGLKFDHTMYRQYIRELQIPGNFSAHVHRKIS